MTKNIGPFSFCPKHNVFYASCKCPIKGKKEAPMEIVPDEPGTLGV